MLSKAARGVLIFCFCLLFAAEAADAQEYITPCTGGIEPYVRGESRFRTADADVRAGIAPHFGLVSGMIARFYDVLAGRRDIRSIILLGPDHFKAGRRSVTVCPLSWLTGGRLININVDLLQELKATNIIGAEALPFRLEHAAGLHIDFIGHYFPNVDVTVLMIKNSASLFDLAKIVPVLAQAMGENTLLLLSMDFSHGKTPEESLREDEKSLEYLLSFRTEGLWKLDIDAPAAAWVFFEVLKRKNISRAVVLERIGVGTGCVTAVFQ